MIRALAIQKFSNKFCSSQAQITFYQAFNFVDASVKKDERKTTNNVQRIRIIWLDLDRFCLDSDPCTCAVRIRIRRQFFNFFYIHILIIEPNPSEQNFVTGKIRIRNTDRRGSGSEGPPSLAVLCPCPCLTLSWLCPATRSSIPGRWRATWPDMTVSSSASGRNLII